LDEGIDFDNDPSCEGDPAPVGGRWTLSGTGSRSSCEEETLNADSFTLSSGELDVKQDGASLSLGRQLEGFTLTGTVRGACVEFQTVESSGGGSISYRWEGKVQSDGSLYGNFTGDGPSACTSQGTFSAAVE
jgi:hypothetical protein